MVLCCVPPPLPVTVMEYFPVGVVEDTAMVMPELPLPGAGIVVGLKIMVAPVGKPEADRAMELLKPLLAVVTMVPVA